MNPKRNTYVQLLTAVMLLGGSRPPLQADVATALRPQAGITMELIGQAQILAPTEAIQYGYLSHFARLETVFGGIPGNESTALLTFYNELVPTQVIANGPLVIINRAGTATFYLNPSQGADFDDPDSFRSGTPVMTATLRHQAVLDTADNTFILQTDFTILYADEFTVNGQKHRLGKPGQKLTWTAYGRSNTSPSNPGQFVIAGVVISHEPVK